MSTALLGARTAAEIEENAGGVGVDDGRRPIWRRLDAPARAVFDGLPDYPDMFRNWQRSDLQRRRYEQLGRLPKDED